MSRLFLKNNKIIFKKIFCFFRTIPSVLTGIFRKESQGKSPAQMQYRIFVKEILSGNAEKSPENRKRKGAPLAQRHCEGRFPVFFLMKRQK